MANTIKFNTKKWERKARRDMLLEELYWSLIFNRITREEAREKIAQFDKSESTPSTV